MVVQYHSRGSCPTCSDALWCDVLVPVVCKCGATTCRPDDASECAPLTNEAHEDYLRARGVTGSITFESI
jgi:hypothetical protein